MDACKPWPRRRSAGRSGYRPAARARRTFTGEPLRCPDGTLLQWRVGGRACKRCTDGCVTKAGAIVVYSQLHDDNELSVDATFAAMQRADEELQRHEYALMKLKMEMDDYLYLDYGTDSSDSDNNHSDDADDNDESDVDGRQQTALP